MSRRSSVRSLQLSVVSSQSSVFSLDLSVIRFLLSVDFSTGLTEN
jgi:hypothetical protein